LTPLRFTNAEVVALLLGIRTAAAAADAALAPAARSAMARLESVMTPRARERAHALADALVEDPRRGTRADDASPPDSEVVLQLAEAIHACERVRLHYASPSSGSTSRDVDPYGLVRLKHWYLAAHCHLRGGLRTFRLDRIRRLDRDGPRFQRPDGFDAFAAVTSSIALAPFPGTVSCRVRLATDLETARRKVPPDAIVLEPYEDGVLLSTYCPADELAGLALQLLRLPWRIEIIEPDALRDALRAVAARALELAEPPA
jgi:predicted DNA-binding transcriptional regulator YafY